jgi:hypothetical protein
MVGKKVIHRFQEAHAAELLEGGDGVPSLSSGVALPSGGVPDADAVQGPPRKPGEAVFVEKGGRNGADGVLATGGDGTERNFFRRGVIAADPLQRVAQGGQQTQQVRVPGEIHLRVRETKSCVLIRDFHRLWPKAKTAGQGTPKRNILPGCFSWGRNVCAVKTELVRTVNFFAAFPGPESSEANPGRKRRNFPSGAVFRVSGKRSGKGNF